MNKARHAYEFLRRRAAGAGPGGRLPSVRDLASEAGVSPYTLSKALRALCDEGLLKARPRTGIVVPSQGASAVSGGIGAGDERFRGRWEQVALALSRRVRNLGPNPATGLILPKQVCLEFGVSYQTARRALDSLVRQSILMPHGRGFAAVGTRGYGGMGVLCTTRSAREYGTVDENRITRVFSNELERVCAQEGMPLEYSFLGYDARGPTGFERTVDRVREVAHSWPRALAIVQTPGLNEESVSRLCSMLQPLKVPIAVVDFGSIANSTVLPRYRLGVAEMSASVRPGTIMGDFLVDKGYRRIGVVGTDLSSDWQRQRLSGISSRVTQRIADAVLLTYETGWVDPDSPRPDPGPFTPPILARRGMRYRRLLGQIGSNADVARHNYEMRTRLHPIVRRAMQEDHPDVFVGLNDTIAVAVLDILYVLGVDVPGECAVVGFDDTSLAFAAHVSSFNFNWHAFAREILRFGYTCPEHLSKPVPLMVDGYVVDRMTTAGGGGAGALGAVP